jgi:hypothetical protein
LKLIPSIKLKTLFSKRVKVFGKNKQYLNVETMSYENLIEKEEVKRFINPFEMVDPNLLVE